MWNYSKFGSAVHEECHLKIFSIFSSGDHFVWWSGTIWAILDARKMPKVDVSAITINFGFWMCACINV